MADIDIRTRPLKRVASSALARNMKKVDQIRVWSHISAGSYFLTELQNGTPAVQAKFQQVVDGHGQLVMTGDSPHGLAVCRECNEVCRLSSIKSNPSLQRHRCTKTIPVKSMPNSTNPELHISNKNRAEKERKEEVASLIRDTTCLVLGKETFDKTGNLLSERTKLRLVRSYLSEIPSTILQYVSDAKLPNERSQEFFEQLINEISELKSRAIKDQQAFLLEKNKKCTTGRPSDPRLHLNLSYPEGGDDLDITWVSNSAEKSPLRFNMMNIIGCNLRDIVHPEDYSSIRNKLLCDVARSPRDFAFPKCRVAEPVKRKQAVKYWSVFLSGTIRSCPRAARSKEVVPLTSEIGVQTLSNPRMALFLKPKTYYRYMTLHSLDGRILQADERITMVTGYSCHEVVGELAYKFIHTEASAVYLQQARDSWLENKDSGIVTYPLRGKLDETVVYLRSEAELVHYRDENTLELKSGFILINSMIDESEYLSGFGQPSRVSIVELPDDGSTSSNESISTSPASSLQYSPSMSNETLESLLGFASPSSDWSSDCRNSAPEVMDSSSSYSYATSVQLHEDTLETSSYSFYSGHDGSFTELSLSSECLDSSFSSVFNSSQCHSNGSGTEYGQMNDTGFDESLSFIDL